MLYHYATGASGGTEFLSYKLSNLIFTPLPSLHMVFYSRRVVNSVILLIVQLIPLHNIAAFINICRFFESMLLNYAYPCRNWTFQHFARAALKNGRNHWHPWLSGKASALDMPRTWVRLLASVKFFIYSVVSILQCSPCEVVEGPISTRVGITKQH